MAGWYLVVEIGLPQTGSPKWCVFLVADVDHGKAEIVRVSSVLYLEMEANSPLPGPLFSSVDTPLPSRPLCTLKIHNTRDQTAEERGVLRGQTLCKS